MNLRRSTLVLNLLWCFAALAALPSFGQAAPAAGPGWDGHLVWVMPFENNSSQPGLDWMGASFPDIMNQRFSSAGFLTIRRADRRYALQHLGLPVDFHPTLATTFRLAQTLDADYVIFGNYTVSNGHITATARVLDMNGPRMHPMLQEQGSLDQLLHVENALAWKIAMQMDPSLNLEEQTFLAASRDLRLDAFEDYIRGEVEPGTEQKIAHLAKAVQLSPNYTQAWLALGKAYFQNQQYEQAEAPFSKVPKSSRFSLEAQFYAGLSYLYTGDYPRAQAEFASLASVLPMPEVLNNEGIAINRRGQNGTAFFQRVVRLNPQNPDYWFNLAVSQRRGKNYDAALEAVTRCLALRPQDQEAEGLRENLTMLKHAPPTGIAEQTPSEAPEHDPSAGPANGDPASKSPAANGSSGDSDAESATATASPAASVDSSPTGPDYEPLERIARAYRESSFRQAAFEMEQMNGMKLRSMPSAKRASVLCQQGNVYVNDGLLLEAERQFQLAVAADPKSADAYAGLAQVHEYAGNPIVAQQEADTSLRLQPNVTAYLISARIALGHNSLQSAQKNVQQALQLDPNSSAAKGILQAIQARQSAP